jgi:dTDP-glucose pyrophosphorylase
MNEIPLNRNSKLINSIKAIESSPRRIAIVVDENNLVIGSLTDGDIRRCLLDGGDLETPVIHAMNSAPVTANINCTHDRIQSLMNLANISSIPLVDDGGRFQRIIHISELSSSDSVVREQTNYSFAVIMAGGEGSRLRPLTETIPKPMVNVGGISILERQISQLASIGIFRIYISVNYLGHLIENYFGDGSNFGVEILYLREKAKLGTAGALSLLPEIPDAPFIVINGDILTNSDLHNLFVFHKQYNPYITVAAINYRVSVPYGVIYSEGPYVRKLVEKPVESFFCNAGIYILSPTIIQLIEEKKFFNMTDLVDDCLKNELTVSVFPLYEYWSDVGTPEDLEKAQSLYSRKKELNDK